MLTQKEIKETLDNLLEQLRVFDPGVEDPAKTALEDQLAAVIRDLEPNYIGPSWSKREDGSWLLPARTPQEAAEHGVPMSLGWEILGWCGRYLRHFKDVSQKLKLTPEQARLVLWWFAIDSRGRFIYRTGTIQRCKGAGKDPLLAVICLVEWVGPCRFSHWHPLTGRPVAVAEMNSVVQVAATSQEQTKNTSTLFGVLVSDEMRQKYRISSFSIATQEIRARGGQQRIVMVTSNPRSLEGARSTFVLLNETHHWVEGNAGIAMYETVDGNVTKGGGFGARYLAITNAYLPGEDSVAERLRNEYEEIKDRPDFLDFGIFYDSIEAHPLVPMHPVALRIVVPKIRGDAWWLDPESILISIRKSSIAPSRSRRMWLNQIVSSEDALYGENDWKAMECEEYLKPGDTVTLGLDGSKSDDSTALVALRTDGLAVPLGIWEKDSEDWRVPKQAVHSAVASAFKTYNVVAFFADVREWEDDIEGWHETYGAQLQIKATDAGNAIAWDMRGKSNHRATLAHEKLMAAVQALKIKWSLAVNPELVGVLRRHFLNVYRDENTTGVYFRKISRMSSRKIDAYAALLCAHEAMNKYKIKRPPEKTPNRVWMFR